MFVRLSGEKEWKRYVERLHVIAVAMFRRWEFAILVREEATPCRKKTKAPELLHQAIIQSHCAQNRT